MRTIIKLCICLLMISGFTMCFPVGIYDHDGRGHQRYENRRSYRESRRHGGEVQVRINADDNRGRREDHN